MDSAANSSIRQHLIDPEICIRCDTCESTCPIDAVTHNDDNYVVDVDKCNACMDCIPPCPTGAIDNWHEIDRVEAHSIEAQLGWDQLPDQHSTVAPAQAAEQTEDQASVSESAISIPMPEPKSSINSADYNANIPPWSAAHAYTNLYALKTAHEYITASVTGNMRVTEVGHDYDTHHIVLDFGSTPFPVLEGQSIGIIPPGATVSGKPHHARQYSISSPRNGERPGYNNASLTIKRVLRDRQGKPVRGVASNYMCNLEVGDEVQVIGPFGASFLMPNHPHSNIVMICTGTGSAPMRAMTEWRRRLQITDKFEGGKLMLFFGARTQEELPYFGPLQNLPKDFIEINFAFSRTPNQPKCYVQDAMRERAADLAELLRNPETYFYVCGLKNMEQGVLLALHDIAEQAGLSWKTLGNELKQNGRLHLETY